MVSNRALIIGEAARSNLRSGYLGDQAEDALTNFGTFLRDVSPVLKHPDESEVTQANGS